ncbi:MAG TPA: lipid A deacylase LpxR family protein, partial [Acetobacteraceae bacterium]|nr:lipid A deacylase LpxR family protein [Acetobacteraceae bacterium]
MLPSRGGTLTAFSITVPATDHATMYLPRPAATWPLLLMLLLPAGAAFAAGTPDDDGAGIWSLSLENSSITPTTPADRNYTNGIGLNWTSPAGDVPNAVGGLSRWLWGPGNDRISLGVFQQMFTPDDTSANPPNPYQRPYAGYLALHLGLIDDQPNVENTLSVDLGAVGEIALGEQVQNAFHRLIGQQEDKGWGYQLHDEPTLEISGGRTWRLPLGNVAGLATDVLPAVSAGVGNVMDYAEAGAVVRIGQNLDADFGPSRLPPSLEGSTVFLPRPSAWYVFFGGDGQAVAHDLFLEGNTFSPSPRVNIYPMVGEFEAGVAIVVWGMRISYQQVFQTKTWHGQSGS